MSFDPYSSPEARDRSSGRGGGGSKNYNEFKNFNTTELNRMSRDLDYFINKQNNYNDIMEKRILHVLRNDRAISDNIRDNFYTIVGEITQLKTGQKSIHNMITWILIIVITVLAIILLGLLIYIIYMLVKPKENVIEIKK